MPIEAGVGAPDFALKDASEGHTLRLQDALAMGPVVLSVYKSSCRASKVAFPLLERLSQSYPEDRVTVWGIALDSPNVTSSFSRRYEITFPLLVDEDGYPTAQAFEVSDTPTVFLLDRQGNVVWSAVGFELDAMQALSQKVASMLDVPVTDITAEVDEDIPARVPG